MNPKDDPYLSKAHANAEILDRKIKKLVVLAGPIRENLPVMTRYQDFWNGAKEITALFKELKPLKKSDRDLLWNRFNDLCREVKEHQKTGYGAMESLSCGHRDEILQLAEQASLPPNTQITDINDLVERGKVLKNAGDMLGKFKIEMIANHKKACFATIQRIRKTHDAAWGLVGAGKPKPRAETLIRARMNLEANYERLRKARGALENFQIGRDHIRTFLSTSRDPVKTASAKTQLAETEARITDISAGIRKLERWIAEDEQILKGQ